MDKVPAGFKIRELPLLDRSFRVIIQSDEFNVNSPTVLIRFENKECVAAVDSILPGSNLLLIDKYLLAHLGAGSEAVVELEEISLEPARKAVIDIPEHWASGVLHKFIRENLINKPVGLNQEFPIFTLKGSENVKVIALEPEPFALITAETQLEFQSTKEIHKQEAKISYSDIGGLGSALGKIRELVEYPLRLPKAMAAMGIDPPRGILLYGPPGTGKTLIARALSQAIDASFYSIAGPEIISAHYGETERKLRETFAEAQKNAPAIIMIDEIDSITPKRDSGAGEAESRLVATLLTLMDGIKENRGVIVMGTTNRQNSIDPALRRPGRLEYEIYIGIPSEEGRLEILEIHTRKKGVPLDDDVDLQELAGKTHGFVGADLSFLCREAGYASFRRHFNVDQPPDENLFDFAALRISKADFDEALKNISPSALREVMVEVPRNISWKDIGGLDTVKTVIEENIVQGIRNPEVFKAMGIKPARGILLYGPPGTGKTLIAKALANECEANFISIKGPELKSKWFGESEEKVRFIFDTARRAIPCIIFFDEIDALVPSRGSDANGLTDSIVNQLLAEMDGVESAEGVFIIGATNRRELIDEALLRPGRFDYQVEVSLPNQDGLRQILNIHLNDDLLADDVDKEALLSKLDGLSGAEVCEMCRLASLQALRDVEFATANKIAMRHLESALVAIRKR